MSHVNTTISLIPRWPRDQCDANVSCLTIPQIPFYAGQLELSDQTRRMYITQKQTTPVVCATLCTNHQNDDGQVEIFVCEDFEVRDTSKPISFLACCLLAVGCDSLLENDVHFI